MVSIIIEEDYSVNTFLIFGLAVIGGVAVTLQGQFMGLMEQAMGSRASVFITYASGGLVVILLTLIRGINFEKASQIPWYAFSAGILGLVIVGSIGFVIPRMGVAGGFMLIVASQFLLAALIDHFGWFQATIRPMDLTRLVGLTVMLIGVWLVIR